MEPTIAFAPLVILSACPLANIGRFSEARLARNF